MKFRVLTLGFACVAVVGVASACSSSSSTSASSSSSTGVSSGNSQVAQAKSEGTVVWYTGSNPPSVAAATKAFTAKYGIKVDPIVLTSNETSQRMQSDFASGKIVADVVSGVLPQFFTAQLQAGHLVPLTAAAEPSIKAIPAKYMDGTAAATLGLGTAVLGYNTDSVKTPPANWQQYLNPEWKGKILLTDPRGSPFWAQFWYVVMTDPSLGPSYMQKIATQDLKVVSDSATGAQILTSGGGGFELGTSVGNIAPLTAQGAPVKTTPISNPTTAYQQFIGVISKSPHPAAAQLFVNWLLSSEGQSVYNGAANQFSAVPGVPGLGALPAGVVIPDPTKVTAATPQIVKLLGLSAAS